MTHHPLEEAIRDLTNDVGALDPRAGLPGVGEPAPHATRDRVGKIRIGTDDLRILAPELQDRPLEVLRAQLPDLASDVDRPGEEDLSDAGCLAERGADPAAAVDHADQAFGQPGL